MHTHEWRWIDLIEGGLLIVIAPFLLFPTVIPLATLGALLLLVGIWLARWRSEGAPLPVTPFNGALCLFVAMLGVGVLVTAFPVLTLSKVTGVLLGLAVWRYLAWTLRTPLLLTWGMVGMVGLGLAIALVGILSIQWPAKVPFVGAVLEYVSFNLIRLPEGAETGVDANQFAGVLSLYLPLGLGLAWGWRPARFPRWGLVLGLMLASGCGGLLLLTQSRSGWLGGMGGSAIFLGLLALLLPPSRERRLCRWAIVACIVLGAGVGVAIGPERWRVLWTEPPRETAIGALNTLLFRQEVWRWALAAIQDFPFTGCGLGTFRDVVRLLYPLDVAPGYDISHAHNMLLQAALDVGLPGLVAYLALLGIAVIVGGRCVVSAFRAAACGGMEAGRQRTLACFVAGLVAGLGSLHIYGMLDALTLGSKPGLIFWYALGLLAALSRLPDES